MLGCVRIGDVVGELIRVVTGNVRVTDCAASDVVGGPVLVVTGNVRVTACVADATVEDDLGCTVQGPNTSNVVDDVEPP